MAPPWTAICWPVARWPDIDHAAWTLGCTPSDPFDDQRYGATLRPDSLTKIRKGYGVWLDFLKRRGWLDPAQTPLERVTRPRLRAYFQALRAAELADHTVIGRFTELTMALKILAPDRDVSWVRKPDGVTIYALLPKSKRTLFVPDAVELFEWAIEMMDRAGSAATPDARLTAYRDGLMLAIFAACGRRLRSVTLLRTRHELIECEGRYRIELTRPQIKTGPRDRFDLPERLTPYVKHYLGAVRPSLLDGQSHEAVWINERGGPLTGKAIGHRIYKLTRTRFGHTFGPHRFRHAICTTAELHNPCHPGVGARVLGISAAVAEQHYNRPDPS